MTLLVRDEEDIIEWNLRYHLSRGVDHLIVTDNKSTDRTREILREFETSGQVTYVFEPRDDYSQDIWVSRMARMAQEEQRADWVIHSDADEFWWPESHDCLKASLSEISPAARVVEAGRHNFIGQALDHGKPFFSRMIFRQLHSCNALGASLPPKIAHRPLIEPHVHQGNHEVSEAGALVPAAAWDGCSVLHFPARSADQLRNKVAKGGAAYERNSRLDQGLGATWRAMYLEQRAGDFDRFVENQFLPSSGLPNEDAVEDHRLRDYLRGI